MTRRKIWAALAAITLLGALLRFWAIGAKTIWLDEAFSIWMARHGIVEMMGRLVQIDQHPPLYYILLSAWMQGFGDLQGAVRSLSALCSTLTIPVLYGATVRLTGRRSMGLAAALILAVAPFHVHFAQEARMYALLGLLAGIAIYALFALLQWQENPDRADGRLSTWNQVRLPGRAVGYAVAQSLVMWTHNTAAVFFPPAVNLPILAVWLHRRRSGLPSSMPLINHPRFPQLWLCIQGLALLLWLPWAMPLAIQARDVDERFWIPWPTPEMVLTTLSSLSLAHLPAWMPSTSIFLLYWLLALVGLVSLRRRPAWLVLLLALIWVIPLGEWLVSLRRPIFHDRTLIWTTLPFFMLMAMGMVTLGDRLREAGRHTWGVAAPAGLLLAVVSISLLAIYNYAAYFDKEEWADAAAYVGAHADDGDLIIVHATWVQIPFEYYFRHQAVEAELRGAPVDLFDAGVLEPPMTRADLPRLRSLLDGHDQVWLVYSHEWYTDPEQIIPTELDASLRRVDTRPFAGLQIIRYTQE